MEILKTDSYNEIYNYWEHIWEAFYKDKWAYIAFIDDEPDSESYRREAIRLFTKHFNHS